MKKILIITPRSPFEGRGADEQDRLTGIEWWISNGWDVTVITKVYSTDLKGVEDARKKYGIKIHAVPYKYAANKPFSVILKRIFIPRYWDGAAFEYFDPEIQATVKTESEECPDLVWVDYTYLWPLYPIISSAGIPIITRSINFEPQHFLDEDGSSILNKLKVWAKYRSEKIALRGSKWFFAISPREAEIYKKMSKDTPVRVMPLRALPMKLSERSYPRNEVVRVGFMASTYNVAHNIEALRLVLYKIWPVVRAELKDKIVLHVTGQKLPQDLQMPEGVIYEGFVKSSEEFLEKMDLALVPSIFGAGMQQKIFEPLVLGVPTITTSRGLAGYPFECDKHVFCADTKEGLAKAVLIISRDQVKRESVSKAAQDLSRKLFSQDVYDGLIEEVLLKI